MTVLALTGGVGGAKLAQGLYSSLPADTLVCLVNTADDFEYLGLAISPDLDSLTYALSEEANLQTGWGRQDETWQCKAALEQYGVDTWFALGDRDLATHILRTEALRKGHSLTEVNATITQALQLRCRLLPMTDDKVSTLVLTDQGRLAFQDYFVKQRCVPVMQGLCFEGIEQATPNPAVMRLLEGALEAIIICPSNPYVSIAPILELPGLTEALINHPAEVLAVSPIIAGEAVKGPTAKMMQEDNLPVSATSVAGYYQQHYPGLLSGFVLDQQDEGQLTAVQGLGLKALALPTMMTSLSDKRRLAQDILAGCLSPEEKT